MGVMEPVCRPSGPSCVRDTSPEAEEVQFDLLRRAGIHGRVSLLLDLSDEAIEMSMWAIRRAHPDASESALRIEFVRLSYGEGLAREVEARLRAES